MPVTNRTKKMLLAMGSCALVWTAPASAIPMEFDYAGSWGFSSSPLGPTFEATFVADNGGTSAINQVYDQSDFVSFTLTSGTYSNTWLASDVSTWSFNFVTDALGRVVNGYVDASNSGGYLFMDHYYGDVGITSSSSGSSFYLLPDRSLPGEAGTGAVESFASLVEPVTMAAEAVATTVPLPGTLTLMGMGLLGLGLARHRKPGAQQSPDFAAVSTA